MISFFVFSGYAIRIIAPTESNAENRMMLKSNFPLVPAINEEGANKIGIENIKEAIVERIV
jgi:hypothetical protein